MLGVGLGCLWGAGLLVAAGESNPHWAVDGFAVLETNIVQATGADRSLACSNLYEFIQATIAAAEDTPGREAANYLRTGNLAKAVAELQQGRCPPSSALNAIRFQTFQASRGPTWPKPPAIDVPYARRAPVIDGQLNDAVWATAATFTNSYLFNETNVAPVRTTYRLLWDEHNLYFAFDCVDRDLVAPIQPRDAAIYQNDCVEMFILPDPRFRIYWELDISPAGCIYDSLQFKKAHEWGAVMDSTENIVGLQVGVSVRGTLNTPGDCDEGYTVEVAVPFDQLPGYAHRRPVAGETLSLMLARLDRTGVPGSTNSELQAYAFTPLLSWGHNLWNHSKITLQPPAPETAR